MFTVGQTVLIDSSEVEWLELPHNIGIVSKDSGGTNGGLTKVQVENLDVVIPTRNLHLIPAD